MNQWVSVTVDGEPLPHIAYHSPGGFEWGYGGSGPADLSLSLLCWELGCAGRAKVWADLSRRGAPDEPKDLVAVAWAHHQPFKSEIVVGLPRAEWTLLGGFIRTWLAGHGQRTGLLVPGHVYRGVRLVDAARAMQAGGGGQTG